MYFQSVELWKDWPFQEGAERAWGPVASNLPAPDITLDGPFRPSKGRLLSQIRLPIYYMSAKNCNYIRLTTEGGYEWYGWVDRVSELSSDELVEIDWHVDNWRQYLLSAKFGRGMVLRRKMDGTTVFPPQPYPTRYWEAKSATRIDKDLRPTESAPHPYWAWISLVTSGANSHLERICWPIAGEGAYDKRQHILIGASDQGGAPSMRETLEGRWDEVLNLNPESITGAWVSSVAPPGVRLTWNAQTNAYNCQTNSIPAVQAGENAYMKIYDDPGSDTITGSWTTTDSKTWYLTGWTGEVIASFPWGVKVKDLEYRSVVNATSAYISIRPVWQEEKAGVDGLVWNVPMIPIDVTSNAVTAYNLSGSREADRMQIRLDADQARVSGHLGTVNAAIGGGVAGAMAGGPMGAITGMAGAAVGAIANTITTEISYRYATGEFADRTIGINDYRAAHQANGLLMSGGASDLVWHQAPGLHIVRADRDEYSDDIMSADINMHGAHCSEPMMDCTSLIQGWGPMQIANLEVTGPIPKEARDAIKAKFAQGVYIVAQND